MSPPFNVPTSIPNNHKYTRHPTLYVYTNYPTVSELRTSYPPMTRHRNHGTTISPRPLNRPPSTRINTRPSNPGADHHRNNQPTGSTPRPRCTARGKPNCRPHDSPNNCINHYWPTIPNEPRRTTRRSRPLLTSLSRTRSSSNSSIRICSSFKPLPTRKRLMAHQAHAYHIVDPSP